MPPDETLAMPHFTPQQLVFVLLLAVIVLGLALYRTFWLF
jgi:hypothetical protein